MSSELKRQPKYYLAELTTKKGIFSTDGKCLGEVGPNKYSNGETFWHATFNLTERTTNHISLVIGNGATPEAAVENAINSTWEGLANSTENLTRLEEALYGKV